ncbi:MAG: hypothetical protein WCR29_05225, partial [Bacteroidales bacterium]
DNILIKSKNDSNYTKSTSLQQNLIYIVQGDIINYFEAGKLRELAKKSNKDQDYSQALYEFGAYKSHIESIKSDFLASYSSAFELGSTQFILHNSTIDSILSNHFILKFDSESLYRSVDISSKVTTVENLIGRLNDDLRQLVNNEILDLTSDDTSLINMTLDLINSKYQLIQFKKASNSKKIKLIRSISDIISSVNANLNLEARQKEQSTILLGTLRNNIREKFVRFRDLKLKSTSFENVVCSFRQEIPIGDNIQLVLETANGYEIKKEILDGINNSLTTLSLYRNILRLLNQNSSIKNLGGNLPDNLNKKIITQLSSMFSDLSSPKDYLKYDDGETSNEKSPGYNSEKYLEIILRNPDTKTIFIDQPEDNLGNKFIAEGLVRIIREIKFQKQLFLVTHNPSVVVYGDAESIILAKNIGNVISYEQIVLENSNSQKEICSILDGGEYIFSNRSKKYNIHRLLY